jgi:hypothetical protein
MLGSRHLGTLATPMINPNRAEAPQITKRSRRSNWLSVKQSQKLGHQANHGYAMNLPCQNHEYPVTHLAKDCKTYFVTAATWLPHEAPLEGTIDVARDTRNNTTTLRIFTATS